MTEDTSDYRPTFGLADGAPFRAAADLLAADPIKAVRVWRDAATRGTNRSVMVRRRLLLEARALSHMLSASDEDTAMSSSDDRRAASQALADACRALAASGGSARPAIGAGEDKRPLTQREVEWLQEFNRKMVDLGRQRMKEFLRDISGRLRRHETLASLAFRPMRFSNELPVVLQLAEMWREGAARRQSWSTMLSHIVMQQIARKEPPETNDDWGFLREAWELAGVMDLDTGPASAACNQIEAFRRRGSLDETEFARLLATIDQAVAADMARSDPDDLSAILMFRRLLARERNAPVNSAASLLAVWTTCNRKSIEKNRRWPNDEDRLGEEEVRRKIKEDWTDLSNDHAIRPILEDLTTDAPEIGACWSEAADLVFGRSMPMEKAKEQLLSLVPKREPAARPQIYKSTDSLLELALAS